MAQFRVRRQESFVWPKGFLESELVKSANSEFSWLVFARRLYQSAYLLDSHSIEGDVYKDVRNVARMCMGMAIECYLKLYYLAKGNKLHDGTKQEKFGSHSLVGMAKKVGFSVTLEQEKVLHYLSMYIKVKGRYPIPLRLDDMAVHRDDKTAIKEYELKWDSKRGNGVRSLLLTFLICLFPSLSISRFKTCPQSSVYLKIIFPFHAILCIIKHIHTHGR